MWSKDPITDITVAVVHVVPAGPLHTKCKSACQWLWSQVEIKAPHGVCGSAAHAVVPTTEEEGAVVVVAPRAGPTSPMPH